MYHEKLIDSEIKQFCEILFYDQRLPDSLLVITKEEKIHLLNSVMRIKNPTYINYFIGVD